MSGGAAEFMLAKSFFIQGMNHRKVERGRRARGVVSPCVNPPRRAPPPRFKA
jgi:hypothetical protein